MTAPDHRLHRWELDERGRVDVWAVDYGYHNGPACAVCGESFCEHCHPECYTEECPGYPGTIPGEVVLLELEEGRAGESSGTDQS